jgi:hypothetical protein
MRSVFRHPKTQSERKGDHVLSADQTDQMPNIKARARGLQKGQLPTERDDKQPTSSKDRWRSGRTKKPKR